MTIEEAIKLIEQLRARIENNKVFTYMVVHDLKHPTESIINMLISVQKQLFSLHDVVDQLSKEYEPASLGEMDI